MSLRRLGLSVKDELAERQIDRDTRSALLKALNKMNDYFALMTEEIDPPTEQTDDTT